MENKEVKELCLDLLTADSEEEVISILTKAGYWENSNVWRFYGDDDNNFKTIGSQQARPEPALVEKIVNSVDARLMGACLCSRINPESAEAPQTIDDARKVFFGNTTRTELAKGITLAITGARPQQEGMPCITICDIGEGQTPNQVPETFMSIDRKNKLRIPFVQGKFNMGGTGALMFCGKKKIQLLITRRNPDVIPSKDIDNPQANHWSFTVVRWESPPEGPGQVRNPYFKYLAPLNLNGQNGKSEVLSFEYDELPLMPEGNQPYVRMIKWGSCIKLYNYDMRGFKGHVLRKNGLLPRIEILLPEVALPVRVHECRQGFRGHAGSFDTNLIGLRERLENSRSDNLEEGYPASLTLNPQGQPMTAKIYAFKNGRADSYRANQGVVFTINGQTHGWFPKSFFEHKRVKMGRLAKDLLVVVDCIKISVESRAILFKNSRDRLSGGDLRKDIEEELEYQIANHPGLRELRERRRHEEVAEKLRDSKPLEDVIGSILKNSPSLSKLFLLGQRLSRPYRNGDNGHNGGTSGHDKGTGDFNGRPHPTYFRFEKLKDGELLKRSSEYGRRCRIKFITDVENEYFVRETERGRYHVEVIDGPLEGQELTSSVSLYNGKVNWSVSIPEEDVAPNDIITIQLTVNDDVMPEPIVNVTKITLISKVGRPGSSGGRPGNTGSEVNGNSAGKGDGSSGKGKNETKTGLQLPEIKKVRCEGWEERGFDEYSVCTVVDDGSVDDEENGSMYTFYINVDNLYLQTDIKGTREDPALLEAKFIYGNVLVGLALIHDLKQTESRKIKGENINEDEEIPIARKIEEVSRALGPFMVPMIDYLGGLQEVNVSELAEVGDEE